MRLQKTELQQIADEYEKAIQKEQQQAAEQAESHPKTNKKLINSILMRTTDDSLIAEAYAKIYEGIYSPEIQQALMKSTQLIKAKQPVDPVTQSVVSKDPRASSSLIKFGVENGINSNLEKHFGQDVWNSIRSDKNIAGDLHNWLAKNNLQVTSLLVPQEQQNS